MSTPIAEATLTNEVFENLAALTKRVSGLQLPAEKKLMVQSRLRPRLRALQMPDFASYTELVQSDNGVDELRQMISALTTNVSHFFREEHHFTILTEELGEKIQKKIENRQRVRIWSAGCSNGQEPYSLVMHLLNTLPALSDADFKVLATDIDPKVVSHALAGRYAMREAQTIPDSCKSWAIRPVADGQQFDISDQLKKFVAFRELNLLKPWPMKQKFDAIFCRNVVIYFDIETQEKLWPRFVQALEPHGMLFLGHSERITDPSLFGMKTAGPTAYAHRDDAQTTKA